MPTAFSAGRNETQELARALRLRPPPKLQVGRRMRRSDTEATNGRLVGESTSPLGGGGWPGEPTALQMDNRPHERPPLTPIPPPPPSGPEPRSRGAGRPSAAASRSLEGQECGWAAVFEDSWPRLRPRGAQLSGLPPPARQSLTDPNLGLSGSGSSPEQRSRASTSGVPLSGPLLHPTKKQLCLLFRLLILPH